MDFRLSTVARAVPSAWHALPSGNVRPAPSLPPGLCSLITFSGRPSLITLSTLRTFSPHSLARDPLFSVSIALATLRYVIQVLSNSMKSDILSMLFSVVPHLLERYSGTYCSRYTEISCGRLTGTPAHYTHC